jgi:predicted PurR-regulated permease PerM
VLFWSLLIGGLLGALLAVPLTASLKVLFRRYIWERRVQPQLAAPPPGPAVSDGSGGISPACATA